MWEALESQVIDITAVDGKPFDFIVTTRLANGNRPCCDGNFGKTKSDLQLCHRLGGIPFRRMSNLCQACHS